MKKMYYTLRTLCLVFTLMVTGSFVTSRALGDDVPTFSDPDVTNFAKTYSDFVNDYIDAYKAAKAGDNSKITPLQSKAPHLQAQSTLTAVKMKAYDSNTFNT